MSGICGIYNFDTQQLIEQQQIARMSSLLKHRGGYSNKVYTNHNIALAIESSRKENQPFSSNDDGDMWVIFDGLIFNTPELHKLLLQKGISSRTESYTELIINMYKVYEEGFIGHIDGEFAFCMWDGKNKKLILGRNHSGNKPLYYYIGKAGIIFASEIKSILADNSIKREVDPVALDAYFSFSYVPTPDTLFKDIKQVPAGSMLICQNNKIMINSYWRFNKETINSKLTENKTCEILLDLLSKAVKKRSINSNNIGAFLSGGLDTAVVVSLLKNILNKKLKVFSVGFDDDNFSELPKARMTANFFDVEMHEAVVDANMGIKAIPEVIWHTDSPFWDISSIPTYYASLMASENVSLVMTGDGSDQLLAGSTCYVVWKKSKNLFPDFLRTQILGRMVKIFNGVDSKKVFIEKIVRNAKIESFPLAQRYVTRSALLASNLKNEAYSNAFRSEISNDVFFEINNRIFNESNRSDFIEQLLFRDILLFLHDDLLVKVDRMLSANSLEFTTPFLDKDVMNFISIIPVEYKIKGIFNPIKKYILKKAFKGYLPAHVLDGRKMGFSPPQKRWMQNEFKEIIFDNLLVSNNGIRKYFNMGFVKKILEQFNRNEYVHHRDLIWALFMFELWHKAYIENAKIQMPSF